MSSSNSRRPVVVGLTGGIGCGKTTVLECFRQMGVPCFMADRQGASYYEESDFCEEIRRMFGPEVFESDGRVDKSSLAKVVFSDRAKLQELNRLVHPRVESDFARWLEQQEAPFVMYECAILYEYGLERKMDQVVCVYLELEERMRRLQERDHEGREAIELRMRNQLSAEEKMDRADYVILNYEGNPRKRQCEEVRRRIEQYVSSVGCQ